MTETNVNKGSKVSFDDAWRFIVKVGLAAHKYGSTSGRLASFLTSLAKGFGYQGEFKSTPVEISFGLRETPDAQQRVEVMATPPPDIDLDKLARLGDVLNEIKAGTLSLKDANSRIDAIEQIPPPWGKFASMLGYVFTGFGIAPLLGAGWTDTLFAAVFSIITYGIVLLSARLGASAMKWMPLTSALIIGFLATMVKHWVPDLNLVLVIISAVAIILPGYSISLGAGELVTKHLASGLYNLKTGLITLLKQIAGAIIGVRLASIIVTIIAAEPQETVDQKWMLLYFPVLLVGLALAFQVSRRDLPWSVLVSAIAFLGVEAGSEIMNANLGNVLGTIVAVVVANFWARKTGRPASIVLIPAIVMMVSGTIGFRGLATMASGDMALGMHQFFQMFIVALTILVGVVIGFFIVRPEPNL
ncbi:threonine/serine exporter family protein [Flavihumibacter fluvii]|uniref:threonine/serine exporter family protein n=1 Tax=Flavihumibacter fluvii TaxID=2838157 RepID=UPI001BDF1117|nr:threonine/serine exporter family protein [Flavihumibacter fluvii]ULQ51162.1 threonine/serine exporter family protein [Flavihumibacter fluvii]